jgi:hypothetical protein
MMGRMRYVTATIGAIFIFAAVVLISFAVNLFLPPALQNGVVIPLGIITVWGTPALLAGIVLGIVGAVHSFRSTIKRSAVTRQDSQN